MGKARALSILLLAAACLACFAGCGTGGPAEATPAASPGAAQAVPQENRALAMSNMGWLPNDGGTGFFIPGTTMLSYYDMGQRETIALCSQLGCHHVDESCEAWIGRSVALFTVYGGQWIAVDNDASGSVIIRSIDPQSRDRKAICELPGSEGSTYYAGNGFAAHGGLYLTLTENRLNDLGGYSSETAFARLDLKSGKLERLLEFTGEFTAQFAGATDSKVLFLVNYLNADLMPLSEYSSQNPDGDYAEYLDEMWSRHSVSELRLYDMDMSAYDVVDSGDLWLSSSQILCRYGDLSLYAKGGELYLYDLAGNTAWPVSAREGIINFWIMDGRVFYITSDDGIHLFYCGLDGGDETEMKGSVSADAIVFSPSAESGDAFYGVYYDAQAGESVRGWIYKSDFYAENYGAVTAV